VNGRIHVWALARACYSATSGYPVLISKMPQLPRNVVPPFHCAFHIKYVRYCVPEVSVQAASIKIVTGELFKQCYLLRLNLNHLVSRSQTSSFDERNLDNARTDKTITGKTSCADSTHGKRRVKTFIPYPWHVWYCSLRECYTDARFYLVFTMCNLYLERYMGFHVQDCMWHWKCFEKSRYFSLVP